MRFLVWIAFCVILISCQNEQKNQSSQLGTIDIDVTVNEDARAVFEEALLLLHSFEYKDAAEKFRTAQELDPECAMAIWGEAMCENHPLWREQNLNNAREIISKLGDDPETRRTKFKTEFEQDMYDAMAVLYGSGSKNERDQAYALKMEELHGKYPDNHEITSFYALSLLGAVKGGRDFEAYAKGAKIAESVIKENPNHPGALHYLIHSYDDPDNAHKALEAANSYSKVAPDAGHALHMPSHIYVALGMWDEVISSNIASWNASVKRKEKKELDNDALNYHAFKWQMYGHLQKAEYDKARALVEDMQGYCYEKPSARSVSHLVMMKAPYFIETGNWADSLFNDTIDYTQYPFYTRAVHEYLTGMRSFHLESSSDLTVSIDSLSGLINRHTNAALLGTGSMCSGVYSREAPTTLDIERSKVLLMELEVLKALSEGNDLLAEAKLKEAVQQEQNTSYNYGPPEIVKPSSEMYAEFLFERKRFDEAKEQLELVLDRAPGRYITSTMLGKLKEKA